MSNWNKSRAQFRIPKKLSHSAQSKAKHVSHALKLNPRSIIVYEIKILVSHTTHKGIQQAIRSVLNLEVDDSCDQSNNIPYT